MNEINRTITVNGVNLHVREWNPEAQPTIVMVHGYPDSSHVWDATAQLLAERFHVVVYDVRGAGESDAPKHTKAYSLEHLAGDFRAVINAVSPKRAVHLVAHDWGSIQSWESVSDPAMASRIASYTSISGPSLDHTGYWIGQRLKSGKPSEYHKVVNQLIHSWYIGAFHLPGFAPALWNTGLDKLWPSILERVEGVGEACPNPSQRKDGVTGVRLYRANMSQRLTAPQEKRTTVPVQLIVPERDKFVTVELLDDLYKWVPRLWREDVDAGHWLQVSHPQLVVDRVSRFVDFIESGADDNEAPVALRRLQTDDQRKKYSGKLALVTGAGNGIGRETLLALAEQGADVIGIDIDPVALDRSIELAQLLGANAQAHVMDVSDAAAWEAFAAELEANNDSPSILVNNAGIGMAGPFLETSAKDWEKILGVNLWSVIHGSRLFGQQMAKAGRRATIVNVASAAAFTPTRTMTAYSTTKAAVRMLSDCMRADLADSGIRVITVCPGIVNSGITDRSNFVGQDEAGENQKRARASALYARRNLSPKAVASGILDAIDGSNDEVLVGVEAYGLNWLGRFAPKLARRIARYDLAG